MKKITLRFALSLALVGLLGSGCGVGLGGGDENKAQQRRDAKALEERFQQVRGVYEGTLANPITGLGPLRSKLTMYVLNVREGANPDGTIRIRPALYGRFQLVDGASSTDYVTLAGDYDELGQLSLTSVSGQGGATSGDTRGGTTSTEAFSLKGAIYGGEANIELVRAGGVWGQFRGTRTTVDASAPTASDWSEYRAKLLRVLTPVEGIYTAVLQGGADRIKVSITMTVSENMTTGLPGLMGQFQRLDMPPGSGVGDRSLSIDYDSTTGIITMRGVDGGGSVPGSNYFSGTGVWTKGVLKVSLTDKRGRLGELIANRQPLN